jgi:type IV secretion system protein VirB10
MRRAQWVLLLLATTLFIFLWSGSAFAQAGTTTTSPEQAAPAAKPSTADSSKLVVPAETTIPLVLRNAINSRTAHVGQAIYCETIFPITVGNRIVVPVGSSVKGTVTQVIRPGRVKGRAQIGLRFDSIILPNGTTRPLRATLSGFGGTGNEGFKPQESKIEGASTKGEDAGKVATSATEGTIIGGLSSRSGKGAGIGALSGGVGGLIWVLASRGKEVVLPSGTSLELQLAVPLSFARDEVDVPSRYEQGPVLPRRDPAGAGPGV